MSKIPLTREGEKKLRDELNQLKSQRPKIIKTIATKDKGIDVLVRELLNHNKFISTSVSKVNSVNDRYLNKINNCLIKTIKNKFWSKKNKEILKKELSKKYNKRLSPNQLIKKLYLLQ